MATAVPLVSVIVPAFNAAPFIRQSVSSVLAQTMGDLECIVVDDGSTDPTSDALSRLTDDRLRVIRRPANEGSVSHARNTGLQIARGRFVAFLDADDWWFPEKLELQVSLHTERPDLGLISSGYATADAGLRRLRSIVLPSMTNSLRGQLLLETSGIGFSSTALIPTPVLDEVGGFAIHLSVSEDIDLAERIAARHPIACVPRCLALYRVHRGQNHHQLNKYQHDMSWILDDRFGRNGVDDRRAWLRGRSNLHTRLALYHLRDRRLTMAVRDAAIAARHDPRRLVALPVSVADRRIRQRAAIGRSRRTLEAVVRTSLVR